VTKQVVTIVLVNTLAVWILAYGLHDVGAGGPTSPNFGFHQSYPWPMSTPAAQGLDPARISAGLQQIQADLFILSVSSFGMIRSLRIALPPKNDQGVSQEASYSGVMINKLTNLALAPQQGLITLLAVETSDKMWAS